LYEHQFPGKNYEVNLREQGISLEDVRNDLKAQLAETNLYIKRMNLNQNDIRDVYDKARGVVGIPERAQIRLVVVPAGSEEFKQAEKLLVAKTDFAEVAKQVNPPQLRANGGLLGPLAPLQNLNLPPALKEAVEKNAEGQVVGPVDLPNNGPALKGWLKVEKKLPAFKLPYENAAMLVARQLVQQKVTEPANSKYRDQMVDLKLNAKFEPTDGRYLAVWEFIKRDAKAAQTAQNSANAVTTTPSPK
jgi:parvulin-like peptidyl-prolyl isomerase